MYSVGQLSTPFLHNLSNPSTLSDSVEWSESNSISAFSLELKDCTIPCFDIFAIALSKGEERTRQINAFCESLHEVGFVALKAESLIPLLDEVYKQTEAYFGQANEVKLKDQKNQYRRDEEGYYKKGSNEWYQFDSEFKKCPEHLPQFKDIMGRYLLECSQYMQCALQLVTEFCVKNSEEIDERLLSLENYVRLIKYSAPLANDDSNGIWLKAHTDLTVLTILPHTIVPGLQMLTKEGEWIDVLLPKGYLVLNTGEQLEKKSAGYFRAVNHRVVIPEEEWKGHDRYTAVFAANWPSTFSLKYFNNCIEKTSSQLSKKENEAYSPDITVSNWLKMRREEEMVKNIEAWYNEYTFSEIQI